MGAVLIEVVDQLIRYITGKQDDEDHQQEKKQGDFIFAPMSRDHVLWAFHFSMRPKLLSGLGGMQVFRKTGKRQEGDR